MKEQLLRAIEHNARRKVTDLAAMLGASEAAISSELTELEKEGIIRGYHTLINWDKTNEEKVTALIEVRVTPQRGEGFDKIAERIYLFDEVKSLYLISGGFDFTVTLEGTTMKEVALFVAQKLAPLDAVLSTATHFVLKRYKEYGIILDKQQKDERMAVTP